MTKKKQSVGEKIYSGTATFGRLWAVVSAIFWNHNKHSSTHFRDF